jgi:hypothetical protein
MRSMNPIRPWLGCCTCLVVLLGAASLRAETPPSPLRLLPDVTDVVVEVRQPRQLVEALTTLEAVKGFMRLEAVQEFYDSTSSRRFYQLLAYFEKELGAKWPELLDQLGGGGAALGVKIGPDPAPALLVLQGKDEALMGRFAKLALQFTEGELARAEAKEKPEKGEYRKIETVHIGDKFFAAVVGSALFLSNQDKALQAGIDLHLDGDKKSMVHNTGIAEAKKLLPPDPLATAWLNLETVRKAPGAEKVFMLPRNDQNLTILFGNFLDLGARSPYLCAGLYRKGESLLTTIRVPRGREGMTAELALHAAPADQPAVLPLLEPQGVMYSSSSYFDLGGFWEKRDKLFTKEQVKGFEDFDKNSGRFLAGTQLSKLLTQVKPYQRFVVAHQSKSGYKTNSKVPIPAFAFVVEMKEPEAFSKSMDTILRGVALLVGSQAKLKLTEEKHGEHTLVGYRFPEDTPLKGDDSDIRFNFSPCFVPVGKQFLAASTIELGHELIDMLEKEAKDPEKPIKSSSIQRFYGTGGVDYLKSLEDLLVTQVILSQAVSPDSAKAQVRDFLAWIRTLGTADIEIVYGDKDSRIDLRLAPAQ